MFLWFPVDWFRAHLQPVAAGRVAAKDAASEFEGLVLLDLRAKQPSAVLPPRELPALRPAAGVEFEAIEDAPAQLDGWDWSYDPLVPLRAGAAEPALRGARLADERLDASLSWRGPALDATRDTTNWRAQHFSKLQHAIFLTQRSLWTMEARAIWMDRHELWVKLYGDDGDWP